MLSSPPRPAEPPLGSSLAAFLTAWPQAYKAVCALIVHEMKHLKPVYRLKLFYVMSAVLRASKTRRGDRDKYGRQPELGFRSALVPSPSAAFALLFCLPNPATTPLHSPGAAAARFEPLLGTVAELLEPLPADQLPSVLKVLDLWWCDDIFNPATIAGLQKRFKALVAASAGGASSAGGSAAAAGGAAGPAAQQPPQEQQQQPRFQMQYQQPQQQLQQYQYPAQQQQQLSPAVALSSMSPGSLSAGLSRDGPTSAAVSLGTAPPAPPRPPSAASRAPGAGGEVFSGWAGASAAAAPLHAVGSSSRLLEQQHQQQVPAVQATVQGQAPQSQQGAYDPFNPDPTAYLAAAAAARLPPPPVGQVPPPPPPPAQQVPPPPPPPAQQVPPPLMPAAGQAPGVPPLPPPAAPVAPVPAANGAPPLPQQLPSAAAAAAGAQTPRKRKSRWADS
jgi:hypothetical protein